MIRRLLGFPSLIGYLRLGLHKGLLPRVGRGVDYSRSEYARAAERAVAGIHPREMRLRVTEIIDETRTTKTFRFVRVGGPLPPFNAGQYLSLHARVDGVTVSRPYSISSRPGAPHLDLTVRDKPGGFVAPHLLGTLSVGDVLTSGGPAGSFYHEPLIDSSDLVFLAGGSGITPFMSMLRDQAHREWPATVGLLYGSRVPDDVVFGDELATLAENTPELSYSLVISEPPQGYDGPTGLLDREVIGAAIGDPGPKTFYICGPSAMIRLCSEALAELDVPRHRIRRELYGPPADVTRLPGWPKGVSAQETFEVEIEGGRTIRAVAGEPLLNALERHGVVVRSLCRSGECSLCRLKLLAGQVFVPEQSNVRESDRELGYIHACVTHPVEDLKIRL